MQSQQLPRYQKRGVIVTTLLFATIAIFFILLASQKVYAHHYWSTNTIPQYGFLPGVSAHAEVTSNVPAESQNGRCMIRSYTSPATTINVIGWTWWQCDALNNANVIVNTSEALPPRAVTASSTNTEWWIFRNGGTKLRTHGMHDFNHNNSNPSPWRPGNLVTWQH
jgi:hypothetical protein